MVFRLFYYASFSPDVNFNEINFPHVTDLAKAAKTGVS